mmetsp:Transcript_5756/g.19026  ORF Transcript_5756/g.19026 Transcript_5756/m.19026 type:complete len:218 (+) Transcript_5756:1241-1894(+)
MCFVHCTLFATYQRAYLFIRLRRRLGAKLLDMRQVQAIKKFSQGQIFHAVRVGGPKNLLQLRIQQASPMTKKQDLHGFLHGNCSIVVLVVHEEFDDVKQPTRLVSCLVISTAMIHRLELWPVHALVTIIVHLPNHVFDVRLFCFVAQLLKHSAQLFWVNFSIPGGMSQGQTGQLCGPVRMRAWALTLSYRAFRRPFSDLQPHFFSRIVPLLRRMRVP